MKSLWEMRESQSTSFGTDFLTPRFRDCTGPPDCTSLGYLELMLLHMDLRTFFLMLQDNHFKNKYLKADIWFLDMLET